MLVSVYKNGSGSNIFLLLRRWTKQECVLALLLFCIFFSVIIHCIQGLQHQHSTVFSRWPKACLTSTIYKPKQQSSILFWWSSCLLTDCILAAHTVDIHRSSWMLDGSFKTFPPESQLKENRLKKTEVCHQPRSRKPHERLTHSLTATRNRLWVVAPSMLTGRQR